MKLKYDRSFLWFGLLSLAVLTAVATAFLQTQFFIEKLVLTTNKAATARSELLVASAFRSLHSQLEKVTIDNSYWDDAVTHTFYKVDENWLQTNWGETTAQVGYVYDTALVVNGMSGQTIASFQAGKTYAGTFASLLGPQGAELLVGQPVDPNTSAVRSGFIKTERGLAIAAMSPIVPYDPSLRITTLRPNYLVLIKHLDAQTLSDLGNQFLLEDLTAAMPTVGSSDAFKVQVGATSIRPTATWRVEVVGPELRRELWSKALSGLIILFLILAGLAMTCWRFIRSMQQTRDAALIDARRDVLTGLSNRLALREHFETLALAEGAAFSIAFCDLDGFKKVNDVLGHQVGDELLQFAAEYISKKSPEGSKVFRLGGDEFVVYFGGPQHLEEAIGFAKNASSAQEQPLQLRGHAIAFGMSVGITSSKTFDKSFLDILRRADTAMYAAKKNSQSHWCRFEDIEGIQELRGLLLSGNRTENELAARIA